jgi:type I restriction enzyme, S subunit
MNYISQDKFNVLGSGKIQQNDILYCLRGSLGKTAIIQDIEKGAIASSLVIIRPSKDITTKYLYYFLTSYLGQAEIYKYDNGSTQPNLSAASVKAYQIPLPPLEEQKRIAAILDKADRVRRKRQEAIRLTEELGRSIFLDMFGDPVTNPKGWEECNIQDLCSIIVDCPHSTPKYLEEKNGYPCIRTSDLQNGYLDFSTTKHVGDMEYQNRVSRHIPVSGDILYSREGERFGIAARVRENYKLCLGQRMMLFQPDFSKATSAFLWSLLNSQSVYHQATQSVGGSTSPHVNVKDIKKFKAFCPPLEMQVVLENTGNRLDSLREKNIKDFTESENLFNSLLQRAFRGEL